MINCFLRNSNKDSFLNELDKVKDGFKKGELESLRIQLESFISYNRNNILPFKTQEEANWNHPIDFATAMKLFILKVRTIDTAAEMRDQINATKSLDKHYTGNTHFAM
jgi:hypothetical protein